MKREKFVLASALAVLAVFSCDRERIEEPDEPHEAVDSTQVEVRLDTSVYVCGVEFPEAYDWQRDSAFGNVAGKIVLFKNGERILEANAGTGTEASTAADLHHLVQGHLYTEFCSGNETIIGKDGKRLLSYSGKEILRGIIVDGEDLFTLGQNRSGDGFALRKNGEMLFSRDHGKVFGEMSSNFFYRSGALYMDDGHMCFCYCKEASPGNAALSWYMVKDNEETRLGMDSKIDEVCDIRLVEGTLYKVIHNQKTKACTLIGGSSSIRLDMEGRGEFCRKCMIGNSEGEPVCLIQTKVGSTLHQGLWTPSTGFRYFHGNSFFYMDGRNCAMVDCSENGTVSANSTAALLKTQSDAGWYFPSFRIGQQCGASLFLALNPLGEEEVPFIWHDGKTTQLPLRGFLTNVEVILKVCD